jgi:hypothetical protein
MHPEAFAKGKEANPCSRTSRLNRLRVRKSRPTLTVVPLLRFAGADLAKLADPFSASKRRFRVALYFNDDRVDIPRLDRTILGLAHAHVRGRYEIVRHRPQLEFVMDCQDLGFNNPPQEKRVFLETVDVKSLTKLLDRGIPPSALRSLGDLTFEAYWYNRQRLRGVDSIGNRSRVLNLQHRWAGIMLFRDGYRVYPYGAEENDWLNLDREALASSGYKLNEQQFIGRVQISRLGNPHLVDQTNREGLKDCPEKRALVELFRWVIQERLAAFLMEVSDQYRKIETDLAQSSRNVEALQNNTKETIRRLRIRHPNDANELSEILSAFDEMRSISSKPKFVLNR